MIRRLAIVGVGLIGGSFAAALRAAGAVDHVVGVGRNRATLEQAKTLGLIDTIATDLSGVRDCDFIFVATPVGQIDAVLTGLLPHLDSHAVVTDGGSTKRDVVSAAHAALKLRIGQFVPGHPIAGAEKSGPSAADKSLYQGRKVILTPLVENDAATIERVAGAWRACGAQVHQMSPAQHDAVLAMVSHLPHVLAYALVDQFDQHRDSAALWAHAGSGFRDFTRIASSSPEMWRDICIANADALLASIDGYSARLAQLRDAIERRDATALATLFTHARDLRERWGQSFVVSAEPRP